MVKQLQMKSPSINEYWKQFRSSSKKVTTVLNVSMFSMSYIKKQVKYHFMGEVNHNIYLLMIRI